MFRCSTALQEAAAFLMRGHEALQQVLANRNLRVISKGSCCEAYSLPSAAGCKTTSISEKLSNEFLLALYQFLRPHMDSLFGSVPFP